MLAPSYYYSHLATPLTPNRPRPAPSAAPPAYTTGEPSTPSRRQAAPSTPSTPSLRQASPIAMIGHGTIVSPPPASTVYYAVGGGAIVHSDLTSALSQFTTETA
ncbi:hypothetical protein B0H14DRAFT_3475464 [Mycena olivaceomarginata]|nr:hypothetical protein B0H14DRAFT_3475464 [Mycena olivaceomarginata]